MPEAAQKKPIPISAPQLSPSVPCRITEQPDGGIRVEFLIEPDAANRIRKRAYIMDLTRFLWEQMLKQAISNTAY